MSKRILLLVHKDLVPPSEEINKEIDRFEPWITEYDVKTELSLLGFDVLVHGLIDDIKDLQLTLENFKPHIVFNLLEEFNYDSKSDYKVISLLEMLNIKYTGCNSKGLILARDKALTKKILKYHNLGTPNFYAFPKGKKRKKPKHLSFPLIVKCLFEEASYGISQASIVHSEEKLQERIQYIHQTLNQDAIVEEFIEGRELYVGVFGNKKLTTLPAWELVFENVEKPEKEIYSSRAKWNEKYRQKKGITSKAAQLDHLTENKIYKICKKAYTILGLSGYARIDFRISTEGKIHILEINPNPNIAKDDEFAKSALHSGISYSELLEQLL